MNKIDFKKWSFRFTIWNLIINIISFYLTIDYSNLIGMENNPGLTLFYLRILGYIFLLLTIIFIIISTSKKEKKNYQYWISIIGIILFGIFPFVFSFF